MGGGITRRALYKIAGFGPRLESGTSKTYNSSGEHLIKTVFCVTIALATC
jgi:hypothetical protein